MMVEQLQMLMQMLGGGSQPPGMGGPQPPQGTPYPMGLMGGNDRTNAALQGIGAMRALEELRKFTKTANTVPAMAPKMTATTPFQAPIGRADEAALQQLQQARAGGGAPGMGAMGGGGGMQPPGAGPAQLMQMLAMRGMGGGMGPA